MSVVSPCRAATVGPPQQSSPQQPALWSGTDTVVCVSLIAVSFVSLDIGSTVEVVQTWYTDGYGFSNTYLAGYRGEYRLDRTALPSRRLWLPALSSHSRRRA